MFTPTRRGRAALAATLFTITCSAAALSPESAPLPVHSKDGNGKAESWITSVMPNRRQVDHVVQQSVLSEDQGWLYIVGYTDEYGDFDSDAFILRIDLLAMEVRNFAYLDGNDDDIANALAIDPRNGDVLIAGNTQSTDLPVTNGLLSDSPSGLKDILLARYSPNLANLKELTLLGSSDTESVEAMLVDRTDGSVILAGNTRSKSFLAAHLDPECSMTNGQDAFVLRISRDFRKLEDAILVGGKESDGSRALAIDPASGDIFLAGTSWSSEFRCTDTGYDGNQRHRADGFVIRLPADLERAKTVAFFGDFEGAEYGLQPSNRCHSEWAGSIAVDPSTSEIFIAGGTCSQHIPGTWNGAQRQFGGFESIPFDYLGDGFVAKFSQDLGTLIRSTYVGGLGGDYVTDIAIRPETADIVLSGVTRSLRLPGTSLGMQPERRGGWSGFVTRLNSGLQRLIGASFVGGDRFGYLNDLQLSPDGEKILVSGSSGSSKTYPGLGEDRAQNDRDYTNVVAAELAVSALGVAQYPDSSYTGSWFFSERNGEGYVIEVLPGVDKPHVLFYLFTIGGPSGQAWAINGTSMTGNSAAMEARAPRGPTFGAGYNPEHLYYQYLGRVLFDFMGCNDIRVVDDIEIPKIAYPMKRLTPPVPGSKGQCASDTQPGQFALTGSWFNPSRDGEGFVINLIERENQTEILIYWFTYAQESGHQAWFVGKAPIQEGKAVVQLIRPMATFNRTNFDPFSIDYPPWGNLAIEFTDCENARIEYSGHEEFKAISYDIERLSTAPGGHFGECVIP